ALRKGGRPAKELAQGFQCPVHPGVLVNGLGIAVYTGNEQDKQSAFDLSRAQLLGECRSGFGRETYLNQTTQHWHTGSSYKRAEEAFLGHQVYESPVD